jgi:hypothetical protein
MKSGLEQRRQQRQRLAELGFAGKLRRQTGYPEFSEAQKTVSAAVVALGEDPAWVAVEAPSVVYRYAQELGLLDDPTYQRARRGMGKSFTVASLSK